MHVDALKTSLHRAPSKSGFQLFIDCAKFGGLLSRQIVESDAAGAGDRFDDEESWAASVASVRFPVEPADGLVGESGATREFSDGSFVLFEAIE